MCVDDDDDSGEDIYKIQAGSPTLFEDWVSDTLSQMQTEISVRIIAAPDFLIGINKQAFHACIPTGMFLLWLAQSSVAPLYY